MKLSSSVVEGSVVISIDDSGPGVPKEKRAMLFSNRYQQSLDTLAQGTGVGLVLCKKLVDLMGGEITLDESYRSGYNDYVGTRIVINLKKAPVEVTEKLDRNLSSGNESSDTTSSSAPIVAATIPPAGDSKVAATEDHIFLLPDHLSVLFVDDDLILRKQGSRAIKMLRPGWKVKEAASGEACLQMTESESFDVMFIDQYMTSVEQSLKGTETVRELRSRGSRSIVCGLSANNLGESFAEAGADNFCLKPFPCRKSELERLMKDLLSKRDGFLASYTPENSSKGSGSSACLPGNDDCV